MHFQKNEYVPKIDPDYKLDRDTTLAILAGFLLIKECLYKGIMGLVINSYRASSSKTELAVR